MKVYQVVEGFFFYGETQETIFGTYSTEELAKRRERSIKSRENINPEHVFIRVIEIDKDIR